MLREVVRPVVSPERTNFVAGAVVGVEPEVQDDGIQQEFDWEPRADGGEVPGVEIAAYENDQRRPDGGEEGDGAESLEVVVVCHLIAGVSVAVEEANSVDEESRISRLFDHAHGLIGWDLLCTKVDQRCACPRYHVQIRCGVEKQSCRKRETLPIVEFRIRKLYQGRPKSM